MQSHVSVWVMVILVVAGTAGVPVAAATATDSAQPATDPSEPTTASVPSVSTQSTDEIRMITTLDRSPDRVGELTAAVSFQIPDRVSKLTARLPEGVTVTETDGFEQETDTEYEWDEQTDRPSVTFRLDADRLTDGEGPLAEDGQYLFADTDEWALVRIPSTGVQWRQTGDELTVSRETETEGPGVAGDRMAFLGPHEIETHTAHDQTFRLVVPGAAELDESPEAIFDSLSHASNTLRVGDRDSEVLVIAAPTDAVEWGVRGLQVGDSDMWVQDTEQLDTADNVWVHEYVHTRQAYKTTAETRWFSEATGTYYAALLSLEAGHIEFEQFQRVLEQGEADPQATSVLSQPDKWENNANYWKGSLVAGEIDRQIRVTTDSETSFETVFRSLNEHDRTVSGEETAVTASDFEQYVATAANDDVADESTRYTTTEAVPTAWNRQTHADVFGQAPAQFRFRLADDEPVRITGPDRSTALDGASGTLTVGETFSVEMAAENVGGTVGSYELPFRVDGSKTTETGRLRPSETATHQFEHTFSEPGAYTVFVGDEQFDILVEEPEPTEEPTEEPKPTEEPEPAQEPEPAEEDPLADVETPGFGVVTAVSTLLLILSTARRRY